MKRQFLIRNNRLFLAATGSFCLLVCTLVVLLNYADFIFDDKISPTSLNRRDYSNSTSTAEEEWAQNIKCYAIPYGLVGFVSHVWTYYTVICLISGVRPFMPWKPLKGNVIDVPLALGQGISTIVLAGLNVSRCSIRWQLVAITIWKIFVSLGLSFTTIVAWSNASNSEGDGAGESESLMVTCGVIYALSCVPGLAGLASIEHLIGYVPGVLIHHEYGSASGAKCEIITIVFIVVACVLLGIIVVSGMEGKPHVGLGMILMGSIPTLGAVFALYSDWILGVVAQDLIGNPLENRVLYWVYFAVKRLPFFAQ